VVRGGVKREGLSPLNENPGYGFGWIHRRCVIADHKSFERKGTHDMGFFLTVSRPVRFLTLMFSQSPKLQYIIHRECLPRFAGFTVYISLSRILTGMSRDTRPVTRGGSRGRRQRGPSPVKFMTPCAPPQKSSR